MGNINTKGNSVFFKIINKIIYRCLLGLFSEIASSSTSKQERKRNSPEMNISNKFHLCLNSTFIAPFTTKITTFS